MNRPNKYGQNALYVACKNGNVGIVEYLVRSEANPHIQSKLLDNYTESPMEVAIRWNHVDCVAVLLKHVKYRSEQVEHFIEKAPTREMAVLLASYRAERCRARFCCF